MNLRELLRHLRAEPARSDRAIARSLGVNRKTVAKYRAWAAAQGLLAGPLPDLAGLHTLLADSFPDRTPPQSQSSLEPFRAVIEAWHEQGLKPKAIQTKLRTQLSFRASYGAVWRFVHWLAAPTPEVVVRIETAPGEEAQVDFGYAGRLWDPVLEKLRRAWVFVLTLSWSRHMYAEFVFDQKVDTWLWCHRQALEFLGGVPERLVIDNLKAGIQKACWEDPLVQQAYRECAEHYGFLIAPCRPATPQHKGKVERGGVGYIKQSFVPLLEPGTPLPEANRQLRGWLLEEAGQRRHGTTQEAPLTRFARAERAALSALPPSAYEPAIWKSVKVHRDGHVVFERSFYSAPCRLVGQQLWLRASPRAVQLFAADYPLVATHTRAQQPGQWVTHRDHLPPEKVRGWQASRSGCRAEAEAIGPATTQVVGELLAARPVDKLRTAVRVLKLGDRYTPERLEAACARGLAYGEVTLAGLKRILQQGLDQVPVVQPEPLSGSPNFTFARSPAELDRAITGGASWN